MYANLRSAATVSFLGFTHSLYAASNPADMTAHALKTRIPTAKTEEQIREEATVVLTKYLERYKDHWPTIDARQEAAKAAILAEKEAKAAATQLVDAPVAFAPAVQGAAHDDCDEETSGHSESESDEDLSISSGSTGLEEKAHLLII